MLHKIASRLLPLTCAFGVGLITYFAYLLVPLSQSTEVNYELKSNLVECRMISMFEQQIYPETKTQPRVNEYFMAIENDSFNGFNLNHTISCEERDPYLFEHNCGTLSVSITNDGGIYLNLAEQLGTAQTPEVLSQRLRGMLDERIAVRAYRENITSNPNFAQMTEAERVAPLQVLIRPACANKYEDVWRVVEAVKQAGAEQIALQIKECETVDAEVNRYQAQRRARNAFAAVE